jgi:hypothetical protein
MLCDYWMTPMYYATLYTIPCEARLQGENYQHLIVEKRQKLAHITCKGTIWTKNFGVEKQVRHKCFRKAYLVLENGGIDLYKSKQVRLVRVRCECIGE